jgi:phage gp29-like protein
MPGDGKWFCHMPYGQYRGWMRGAVRQCAQPWLLRNWSFTYMARFAEVHGMPIRKAIVPAASDEKARDLYAAQLANLGAETTLMVQTGVDGAGQDYDLELVEAKDTAWEVFPGLIDRCDMDIILAIMMQNLTTEVTGGSFAATKAHMDIRQGGIEFDNGAWASTVRDQAARPFAWVNFGDADLAPYTSWDVTPREDFTHNAEQFSKFGTAIEVMARGGIKFTDVEKLRKFAADKFNLQGLPDFIIGDPVAGGGGMK